MKVCARCKLEKEETNFPKDKNRKDGLYPYCKICKGLDSKKYNIKNREKCTEKLRKWREKNPSKNNEYAKTYRENNWELIKARNSTKENKEKLKIAIKKWQDENKERFYQVQSEWKKKNRIKTNAHALVSKYVKKGKLKRPKRCQKCKTDKGKIEGHHENYEKPLEVRWLCFECHKKEHLMLNQMTIK